MDSERAPRPSPKRLAWPKRLTPHHKCLHINICVMCMAVATATQAAAATTNCIQVVPC